MNKNDRKRQRRKDFSNGRNRQTTPQDQRSTYPKSHHALRALADRRAKLAGIDPDISTDPGPIVPIPSPSIDTIDVARMLEAMKDAITTQMLYGISPAFRGMRLLNLDYPPAPCPSLHREMKIGEITAYRCWRLEGCSLRSVYMHDIWAPNQIMEGREIEDWSERGIHAWKDLNSPKFNQYIRGYLNVRQDPWYQPGDDQATVIVTGTVLLWGDVVEHEHGYRAEFAKINSLDWLYPDASLMGRERETLANLRNLYGVT